MKLLTTINNVIKDHLQHFGEENV